MSLKQSKNLIFVVIFSVVLLAPLFVFAQTPASALPDASEITAQQIAAVPGQAGLILPTGDPREIVARIIRVALGFLGIVAVVLILYGGFLWMTAAGEEEQIGKAKKFLVNAVIGLAIILSAFAITQFVLSRLSSATHAPPGGYTDENCPGPDCPFLPSGAFVVKRISPQGAVPIRNVTVRVLFNKVPDLATIPGNIIVMRKDNLTEMPGTIRSNGVMLEFIPQASCPEPHQDRFCFDKNTDFIIKARDGAEGLKSIDGKELTCGGFATACIAEFKSGNLVDTAPPTITIESPDQGASVMVDTCVPIQARVTDDAGVSFVEFYADGDLIDNGTVVAPSPPTPLSEGEGRVRAVPYDALVELPCWPTAQPAPQAHILMAKAYDLDDNSAKSRDVRVMVRPQHCFNKNQIGLPLKDDDEDGPNCDSEVDGPSGCGLCDTTTCTEDLICASGLCHRGTCVTPTTITGISPGDGRVGTFVTVAGLNFGKTRGAVIFKDNVLASAPQECTGATTWSNNYALVGVPVGAVTGPIQIVTAGCAESDPLCRDSSDNTRGPIVPIHGGSTSRGSTSGGSTSGEFEVNDRAHPGICSVAPTAGLWMKLVAISGVQFGRQTDQAKVIFGGVSAVVYTWADSSVATAVPPINPSETQIQVVNAQGARSNALPFEVLSPDAGTLPIIDQIICAGAPASRPASGGPGTGCTINGRNFGEQPGMIWFIGPDGQGRQADVSFPAQCGNSWWTVISITIKVPRVVDVNDFDRDKNNRDLLGGAAKVYVQRYDAQQSGQEDFTLFESPNQDPFLACLEPQAGPKFTSVSFYGERFGDKQAQNRGARFTQTRSPWVGTQPADLTNVGGTAGQACPRGGWSATEICAQVPASAVSGAPAGNVLVENDLEGLTKTSNPRTFLVGDCRLPENDPGRINCANLNLNCCSDESCRADCSSIVTPASAFGWQFTTAQVPLVPKVVEECDQELDEQGRSEFPPSPAPSAESGRGYDNGVCVNAGVAITFDHAVVPTTLNFNNIKIEKCSAATNLLTGIDSSFGSSNFVGDTKIWIRPAEPILVPPTTLTHQQHLGIISAQAEGQGSSAGDTGNFALKLTKYDNDTGPGWPDSRGLQQNYEHWFGYQANAIGNTNGTTYSATAQIRGADSRACGQQAGILIQRQGGDWQKAVQEITLPENCTKDWTEVSIKIKFNTVAPTAPGYLRVFLRGDPYEITEAESSGEDFAVFVDNVKLSGDACSSAEAVDFGLNNFQVYPGNLGFQWWPNTNFLPSSRYRVILLGGEGGITAVSTQNQQGMSMEIMPDARARCGWDNAAYCFQFETKDTVDLCEVGGIAVSPGEYISSAENEQINYSATPVAKGDVCLFLTPGGYQWSWDVQDSVDPARANVSYEPGSSVGHICAENADCAIGASTCSNDRALVCHADADCGPRNTCVTESTEFCVSGYCLYMPWTTTATALEDTAGEDVKIQAHVPKTIPLPPPLAPPLAGGEMVTGYGNLEINLEDPRVVEWRPTCGEACINAAIEAIFNVPMLNSHTDPAGVVNANNVQLWVVPCGNGIIDDGEDCDDGNINDGDGCSKDCLNEGSNFALRCSNGIIDDGEDCDDGNIQNNDKCSNVCLNEGSASTCGNGTVDVGEDCDDHNTQNNDGCSNVCLNEGTRSDLPICGNRRLDRGEECEVNFDGTFASWCNPLTCLRQGNLTNLLLCGNGLADPGEECDANSPLLDTSAKKNLCSARCQWTGTRRPTGAGGQGCGNGRIELGEDCDDGNLRPGDGCSDVCLNEGVILTAALACGNSRVELGEDCDDGNINNGDGCSSACLREGTRGAVCGNGIREWSAETGGEDCDGTAGCSSSCLNIGTEKTKCGNGRLDDGEDCELTGDYKDPLCNAGCLNLGRSAEKVTGLSLSWDSNNKKLSIGLSDNRLLQSNTFYRVLLRGTEQVSPPLGGGARGGANPSLQGIYSCRHNCTEAGEPLSGLNFQYDWGSVQPSLRSGVCEGSACNTFSWTFKTKDEVCAVDRVDLAPPQAALYVIWGKQAYSAQPFGPPDTCNPQGQSLNALSYNWLWNTDEETDPQKAEHNPRIVAEIYQHSFIDGVSYNGENIIPSCGNGRLDYGEDCDDGNTISKDGCSGTEVVNEIRMRGCLNEGSNFSIVCGDGREGPGEECDPPNKPGCSANCMHSGTSAPLCGNGVVDLGEDCDDSDRLAGDGCSPQCLNEGSTPAMGCGNEMREWSAQIGGEECDPGDSSTPAFDISGAPLLSAFCNPQTCLLRGILHKATCGNDLVEPGEECDKAGQAQSKDGCSAICLNEGTKAPLCGNTRVDRYEDCDDGNTINSDGCSSECLNEGSTIVGDEFIDPLQKAVALGIFKFCRDTRGNISDRVCVSNATCQAGEAGCLACRADEVCVPRNPWSTVAITAKTAETTGQASLTVYCVAQADKDCPIPGGKNGSDAFGRGLDSCCYERPHITSRTPASGSANACPNGLLEARFSQPIDAQNLAGNFFLARYYDSTRCPAGLRPVVGQGIIDAPEPTPPPHAPVSGLFEKIFSKIKMLLTKIVPWANAEGQVLCVDDTLTVAPAYQVRTDASRAVYNVTLQPSRVLDSSAAYRVFIIGDKNINDATVSGLRSAYGVGFYGPWDGGGVDQTWTFSTRSGICTLEYVQVTGGRSFSEPGEEAGAHAEAQSADHQALISMPGYAWEWSWGSSRNDVATVTDSDNVDQQVTAGNIQGTTVVNAVAKIIDIGELSAGADSLNKTTTGTTEFTTTFCENPWPAENPPNPLDLHRLKDEQGSQLGGGDPMNLSTWYCRDYGKSGADDDLPDLNITVLPATPTGVPVTLRGRNWVEIATLSNGLPSPLKEFLLVEQAEGEEAIGIRIMPNSDRLSARDWYSKLNPEGKPEFIANGVDGYEAIRDGQTVYIAATNVRTETESEENNTVYSNIYVVSLSEGAGLGMQNIYDQLINNLIFNVNLVDTNKCFGNQQSCSIDLDCAVNGQISCEASKAKLRRDLVRLNHLQQISATLNSYQNNFDKYPTLGAGTFIRSMSTSRWPSWDATLGATLGIPLPKDPINRFAQGCDTAGGYDSTTCWNEKNQAYRCPQGSHVYQYESLGGAQTKVRVEFELLERAGSIPLWDIYGWAPGRTGDITMETSGWCNWQDVAPSSGSWSNRSAICGNGVLEGIEVCEIGQKEEQVVNFASAQKRCSGRPAKECTVLGEVCDDPATTAQEPWGVCINMTSCVAERACNASSSASCQWNNWVSGNENPVAADCRPGGTFCGNGIIESGENCDDGVLNGQYGKCHASCRRACVGGDRAGEICAQESDCPNWGYCPNTALTSYCGDGDINGSETCDEGTNNGRYGHCRFDCTGIGSFCGDKNVDVEEGEQCEIGQEQISPRICNAVSGAFGKACSSDGDCNNVAGSCKFCNPVSPFAGAEALSDIQQTNSITGYAYKWKKTCFDASHGVGSCKWPNYLGSDGFSCVVQDSCGNETTEGTEQCDDQTIDDNINDTIENSDACTNQCRFARCGDGFTQESNNEECDVGGNNGTLCTPGYGVIGCTYCDRQCDIVTLSGGVCGDQVVNGPEVCDRNVGDFSEYWCIRTNTNFTSYHPTECENNCRQPKCGAREQFCKEGVDCARVNIKIEDEGGSLKDDSFKVFIDGHDVGLIGGLDETELNYHAFPIGLHTIKLVNEIGIGQGSYKITWPTSSVTVVSGKFYTSPISPDEPTENPYTLTFAQMDDISGIDSYPPGGGHYSSRPTLDVRKGFLDSPRNHPAGTVYYWDDNCTSPIIQGVDYFVPIASCDWPGHGSWCGHSINECLKDSASPGWVEYSFYVAP